MKKSLISILSFIFLSLPAFAEYNNKVHVYNPQALDGDTISITLREGRASVRLTGIDCFESKMNDRVYLQMRKNYLTKDEILDKGIKAKKILNEIISQNSDEIWLNITGIDRTYGRLVGIIYYKDTKGNFVNINEIMKKSGSCPVFIFKK